MFVAVGGRVADIGRRGGGGEGLLEGVGLEVKVRTGLTGAASGRTVGGLGIGGAGEAFSRHEREEDRK